MWNKCMGNSSCRNGFSLEMYRMWAYDYDIQKGCREKLQRFFKNVKKYKEREEMNMEGTKVLVAYFSYSGTTKKVAEKVAQVTGGDLFEITVKKPYSSDYQTVIEEAKIELAESARPELSAQVSDMKQYDKIILGFPNWCRTCPMPVLTFLESYDFSGKTICSFVTNGGGGCGRSTEDIRNSAKGATVIESVDGNQLTEEQIENW